MPKEPAANPPETPPPAEPAAVPPPRPNKRRSRRQAPKGSTKVRAYRNAMGLGPNIAAGVLDLSETGVRLLLKEELTKGKEFEVVLESVSKSIKVIAEVMWTVPTADGQFCTGARFGKTLSFADLSHVSRG